jgi:hypothetical protein
MSAEQPSFRAVGEAEIAACYDLMRQLRPHLASADEFVTRWRGQSAEGYRILALWGGRGGKPGPRALAGYRITENLVHGKFLYVDDLVADQTERGRGYGASKPTDTLRAVPNSSSIPASTIISRTVSIFGRGCSPRRCASIFLYSGPDTVLSG